MKKTKKTEKYRIFAISNASITTHVMKKGITILLFAAALFSACEKEKDYRDKWVGEYTCKKLISRWHYVMIYQDSTVVGMDQQFINYTADGTAKVEKYGSNQLRLLSQLISNEDYDTINHKSQNSIKAKHMKDTLVYSVREDGSLYMENNVPSHGTPEVGNCYSDSISIQFYSGGLGGGSGFTYQCKRR